jgi:hypothetical protein
MPGLDFVFGLARQGRFPYNSNIAIGPGSIRPEKTF